MLSRLTCHPSKQQTLDNSFDELEIHHLLLRHSTTAQRINMSGQPFHSTGRGGKNASQAKRCLRKTRRSLSTGAGNIGTDTNVYTDGGIVREGVQGQSVDGDFSTGRGGAGNITKSPRVGPQVDGKRRSVDMVPEVDVREAQDEFHTGVSATSHNKRYTRLTLSSVVEQATCTRRSMAATATHPARTKASETRSSKRFASRRIRRMRPRPSTRCDTQR
jgi:hypothetical protein